MYVSSITKATIPFIIDVLSDYPNFTIENEYIINNELLVNELEKKVDSKSDLDKKLRNEKIAAGICPNCNNYFEIGFSYCNNCGELLED